jgi:hypothetical protein
LANKITVRIPVTSTLLLDEPRLVFGNNRRCADPKVGLTSHGPALLDVEAGQRTMIRAGAIGTYGALSQLREFLSRSAYAIPLKESNQGIQAWKMDFPGLGINGPLAFDVYLDETVVEPISEGEEKASLQDSDRVVRIESSVRLYEQKFQDLVTSSSSLPGVVFLPLSKQLLKMCREPTLKTDRIICERRTMGKHETSSRVFNFHHALKVVSYQHGMACQIVLPSTMSFARGKQESATVAWNFATALYYKGTGIPWKLAELEETTCLVGISFYEDIGKEGSLMRASMAHVYVKSSDSQIIRGKPFVWEDRRREPTLNGTQAKELLKDVVDLYHRQKKELPIRLVIHKTSAFTDEEISGFNEAAQGVELLDYVHLRANDGSRFFHEGVAYPPVRGTMIGETSPYIMYTVGYVPCLGTYQGMGAPAPLVLDVARNDTTPRQIGNDIMSLTKMDWNSTDFCQSQPVTTSVSRKVGHILAEVRARNTEPPQPYRYYM